MRWGWGTLGVVWGERRGRLSGGCGGNWTFLRLGAGFVDARYRELFD